MKNIKIKLLTNRIAYDMSADLDAITAYMKEHLVNIFFDIVKVDIKGYDVQLIKNQFGNEQYVLIGAEPLVLPFVNNSDDICCLVLEGFNEFDKNCPSESEDKVFLPGTKTVFIATNADDAFYNVKPNFQIWLQHELMHALGTISINAGFPVVDCMDILVAPNGVNLYYFLNYEPDNVNSNFINMWERLIPWLNS